MFLVVAHDATQVGECGVDGYDGKTSPWSEVQTPLARKMSSQLLPLFCHILTVGSPQSSTLWSWVWTRHIVDTAGPAPWSPASLMSQLSRNQSYQSCKTPHLGLASKCSDFFYYQQLFIWFIEMWATTCGSLGWDRTYLKAKHDPENSEAWN